MGKGARVRESRENENSVNEGVKLSKKQLLRIQQKKAKTKKIITTVATIAIIIAVAVAILIAALPKTPNLEGDVAGKGGKYEIDNAMFAYVLYNNLQSYSSYLSYYGYDTSLGLKEQTGSCALDATKTWYEYFCTLAINQFNEYIALASAAEAAGIKLTDEDIKDIDESFKELEENSYKQGYGSANKYLSTVFAPGVTVKAVRRVIELQTLATKYVEKYVDEIVNTEEELIDYRKDNPDTFLRVDYVLYKFEPIFEDGVSDEDKKKDGIQQAASAKAEAAANDFIAKYTTVEAFKDAIVKLEAAKDEKYKDKELTDLDKETLLKDYVVEGDLYNTSKAEAEATMEFYQWAFSIDDKEGEYSVKVNDVKVISSKNSSDSDLVTYTVYMMEKPEYYNDYATKDVRHILFDVDSTLTDKKLEKAFEKAKEEADKVLAEYNKGEKTAEAFAELAKKYSADGNAEKGGIYENVAKGKMVEEFENWIYDSSRKTGDVELVKTEYGWYMMYFVGDGVPAWEVEADDGLDEEKYNDHLDDLKEKYPVEYDYKIMFKIP